MFSHLAQAATWLLDAMAPKVAPKRKAMALQKRPATNAPHGAREPKLAKLETTGPPAGGRAATGAALSQHGVSEPTPLTSGVSEPSGVLEPTTTGPEGKTFPPRGATKTRGNTTIAPSVTSSQGRASDPEPSSGGVLEPTEGEDYTAGHDAELDTHQNKGNGKGNGKGKGKLMSALDIFVLMEHLDRRDRGPPSDSEAE